MNIRIFKKIDSQYLSYYGKLNKASWQIIILKLITSMLISVCYFLPIYFVTQLNLSIDISGLIISCYGIGTIFGGFISGKMSDEISPVLICIISLVLTGTSFIYLIFIRSRFLLVIDLFLLGAAAYSLITATYILMLSACQENESQHLKAISFLETASNLGLGLAALLIGTVVRLSS